jgi:hypothetical protein
LNPQITQIYADVKSPFRRKYFSRKMLMLCVLCVLCGEKHRLFIYILITRHRAIPPPCNLKRMLPARFSMHQQPLCSAPHITPRRESSEETAPEIKPVDARLCHSKKSVKAI